MFAVLESKAVRLEISTHMSCRAHTTLAVLALHICIRYISFLLLDLDLYKKSSKLDIYKARLPKIFLDFDRIKLYISFLLIDRSNLSKRAPLTYSMWKKCLRFNFLSSLKLQWLESLALLRSYYCFLYSSVAINTGVYGATFPLCSCCSGNAMSNCEHVITERAWTPSTCLLSHEHLDKTVY